MIPVRLGGGFFACTSIIAGWGGFMRSYVIGLLRFMSFVLTCYLPGFPRFCEAASVGICEAEFYGTAAYVLRI
jgi:hypothetical protein